MRKHRPLSIYLVANAVTQMSAVLFPLITFPYVSRVLRPDGLGRVSFAEAMVSYFLMFATLGIPLYGVREAARRRDDKVALSMLAVELFLLSTVMTAVAAVAFYIFVSSSCKASEDPKLFWICISPMFVTPVGFNWLLEALEEHVYITVRTLFIRICVVIAVFLFIRTQEDYRIYALVTAANAAGASLLNVFCVRKHLSVRGVDWRGLDIWRHVRPVVLVFFVAGAVSIYTSLNKVILGYLTTDNEVGLYSAADRMVKAVVMFATSIGVVLLPRVSYYIQSERQSEYKYLSTTILRLIFFISFPAAAGVIVMAEPLVLLLSGYAFKPAVTLVQIMGPTIVLIAIGSFTSYQILYPLGKETMLLYSALCGAICNVGLNWALIPKWQAVGAAFSILFTEICVTGTRVVLSARSLDFAWPIGGMLKYAAASLVMAMVMLSVRSFVVGTVLRLLISTGVGMFCYMFVLWLSRDSLLSAICSHLAACAGRVPRVGNTDV